MKKFCSLFLCFVFVSTSSFIFSAETPTTKENLKTSGYVSEPPVAEKTAPKEVGKASNEGIKSGKTQNWQNWLFAGVSVAIAVTALVLLSDSGHSPHHHHN